MARGLRKWLKALLFLAALVLVSGCSFTGIAYNHLDVLVRFYLSDYVQFTPAQRQDFDRRFDTVWDWHRQTQMPRYAAIAHAIAGEVMHAQTAEEIRARLDEVDSLGEPVGQRVLSEGAPLLSTLSDEQVTRLLAAIDKKIAKEHEHSARDDDAVWHQHEFKDSRASFEKYAGTLTAAQEARIRQYTDAAVRDSELYFRAALSARKRFSEVLARRHDPDFAQRLQTMFDADSVESAQLEKMRQASRERFVLLLVDLSATYSDAQRRHFHDRVESLAKDLDELARSPRQTA